MDTKHDNPNYKHPAPKIVHPKPLNPKLILGKPPFRVKGPDRACNGV